MSLSQAIRPRTALVILAAGNSSRMGSPKQLLMWRGKPLIRHAVDSGLASFCNPVIVVVGSEAPSVSAAVADLSVQVIENTDWENGMGSSIRAGVIAAREQNVEGLILALADQPFITPEVLNKLMDTARPIAASEYAGTVGVPVYFSSEFFPDLVALKPSQGCKGLILANRDRTIGIPCPEAELDIDTPENYERLKSAYPE